MRYNKFLQICPSFDYAIHIDKQSLIHLTSFPSWPVAKPTRWIETCSISIFPYLFLWNMNNFDLKRKIFKVKNHERFHRVLKLGNQTHLFLRRWSSHHDWNRHGLHFLSPTTRAWWTRIWKSFISPWVWELFKRKQDGTELFDVDPENSISSDN